VNDLLDLAARPDDAEAKAEDWDRWLVNSFVSPYRKVPLVCRGSYNVDRHGPLFEGMRKLLICRYRRNVLRSYLSFMRKRHDNDEVKCTVASSGNWRGRECSVAEWVTTPIKRKNSKGKLWELQRDLEVGRDAVARAADSSWVSWDAGSTLFFWRWPARCRTSVRDGTKLYVAKTQLPCYTKRQQWPSDPGQKAQLERKIRKV